MIELNLNEIKRRLYADGCIDLLRGMACLRWSLSGRQELRGGRATVEDSDTRTVRPAQGTRATTQQASETAGATKAPFIPDRSSSRDRTRRSYVHA